MAHTWLHRDPVAPYERKVPTTSSEQLESEDGSLDLDQQTWQPPRHRTWKLSWLQPRPLLGIASLGVAVSCMMTAFAVLYVSDGQPVHAWRVQPTV